MSEELTALNGVSGVDVTVSIGGVAIFSDRPLDRAELAGALNTVGYQLAD